MIFVVTSIVISVGIPYLRSVLVVPMLESRYTIIILPSIIISFAYAICLIPNNLARATMLVAVVGYSMFSIIYKMNYYGKVIKEQYREITKFITAGSKIAIVNSDLPQDYYFATYNFKGSLLNGKIGSQEDIADSILQKSSPRFAVDSYWHVDYFFNPRLATDKQREIDNAFIVIKDSVFDNCFAQLYVSANKHLVEKIEPSRFDPKFLIVDSMSQLVAIWSGGVSTLPFSIKKGSYNIDVEAKGTPLAGIFPHNTVSVNEQVVGSFYSTIGNFYGPIFGHHTFRFSVPSDTNIVIKIYMDNDSMGNGEDRNTFLRNIFILKSNI